MNSSGERKIVKLETVKIQGFRSIENVEIDNCGEFNVLIGKNNTGKSNILTAIQTFFSSVNANSIIATESLLGKSIDFFGKNDTQSIKITPTFSLSLSERDTLIRDIINDAPQMRNALEDTDRNLWISVTLTTITRNKLCFVSEIIMTNVNKLQKRTILKVDSAAATELYGYVTLEHQHQEAIRSLRALITNFDRDDWRIITRDTGDTKSTSRQVLRSFLRRRMPRLPISVIEDLFRQFSSNTDVFTYDEFISTCQNYIQKLEESALSNQQDLRKNKINTFSGEELTVHPYVLNILENISKMKVLYLGTLKK